MVEGSKSTPESSKKSKSALMIKYVATTDLAPYARNSRTHTAEQVDLIAKSIVEFGFTNPILVDGDNGIIAGHGRLAAAQKLGMTEVPVIELTGLSKKQKQAYVIADNKLALKAGWDATTLKLELEDLRLADFDLSLIGFGKVELGRIFETSVQTEASIGEVKFQVVVECNGEKHQAEMMENFEAQGFKCRALML